MKIKYKIIFAIVTICLTTNVFAQKTASFSKTKTTPEEQKASAPEIAVDESNFKAIFNQSVTEESTSLDKKTHSFDVEVAASYSTLNDLELSNNYFTVDYAEDFKSVPLAKLSVAKDLWSTSRTELSALANFGYGFKSARVSAESSRGTKIFDQVSLQWIPLSAGIQIKQKIPGTQQFSVFTSPSIGSQYFHQSGNLDGINQGYWLSFWNIRAGFVLFEQNGKKLGASFDGVVIGANLSRGIISSQQFGTWSADLGIKFAL